MVVLDRSNNYNAKTWNTVVIPTVKSITDAVQPSAATNTNLGVVVYPVSNGDRGDQSGGAKVVAGLSHSRSAVDGMVSSVERGVQLNGKKYCVRSPSSSLEWPCGGWTFGWRAALIPVRMGGVRKASNTARAAGVEKLHLIARLTASASSILTPLLVSLSLARAASVRLCSPMWQGLKLAYEQLFPTGIVDASGTRKVVVVVSDGLATKGYSGGRFNRPTYLTLVQATALKDKGTLLMAIGFGGAQNAQVTSAFGLRTVCVQ